jgi:hypothetical protein
MFCSALEQWNALHCAATTFGEHAAERDVIIGNVIRVAPIVVQKYCQFLCRSPGPPIRSALE